MKKLKSTISILLAVIMLFGALPFAVSAADVVESGRCGYNVYWTLDSDGTLTISGEGDMYDYYWSNTGPFYKKDSIKNIKIENGVTSIGDYMFFGCCNLLSIDVPDSVKYIGEDTFHGCSRLKSVKIPNGVTNIKDYAFYYCTDLISVIIPDSVFTIGRSAFEGCSSLTSVIIPNSVMTIKLSAFEDCSSLTSVIIPDSVTFIGSFAFENCNSLTRIEVDEGNTNYSSLDGVLFNKDETELIQYPANNQRKEYTIPGSVTDIGDMAFLNCIHLTTIIIPDNVTSIGSGAFCNCAALTNITIPDGVTSIGDSTFSGCSSLLRADIPDSVRSIDLAAFSLCYSLTTITIPNKVTSIDDMTFFECISLTSVEIPDSITSVGSNAFALCESLSSIEIPDSVTSIGETAFLHCSSLEEITVPESVEYIADHAFGYDCTDDLGNSFRLLDIIKDLISGEYDGDFCVDFNNQIKIDDFTINGYTGSEAERYANDNGFEFISIGSEHIHSYTSSVTTPATCTQNGVMTYTCACGDSYEEEIPMTDHENTTYYEAVDPTCTEDGYTDGEYCDDCQTWLYEREVIPATGHIDQDDDNICDYCYNMIITEGQCGDNAYWHFDNNSGTLTISGNGDMWDYNSADKPLYNRSYFGVIENVVIESGITSIGDWAFDTCFNLTDVTIPNSVTSIGEYAFINCVSLTNVTIPDSVRSIGVCAFYDCESLTSVEIPNGVTKINDRLFESCTVLSSVVIPESVVSIGEEAFLNCDSLKQITIPKSVETISKYAVGYTMDQFGDDPDKPLDYDYHEKVDGFIINGYTGSDAERYANEYGFTFNSLSSEHTHSYKSTVTTAPTCTKEGIKTYTCSCGDTYTETIPATGHETEHVEIPSTCTVCGVSYDICLNCDETFNYSVLPLAVHTSSNWIIDKPADCTNNGEKHIECTVCKKVLDTQVIAKTGHKEVTVKGKAATCTETGLTDGKKCSACGVVTVEQHVIEKLEHVFGEFVTVKQPSYTQEGVREATCSACGFKITEPIKKLVVKNETTDEKTGISVGYDEGSFENNDIAISVTEVFDGESFNVLNSEKGNFRNELFDIVIKNGEEKVQPYTKVLVSIPLPDGYNPEKTVVYYVTNNGQLEKLDSFYENGCIIFEVSHFSHYALVDESTNDTDCTCICHKTGFMGFIYKIFRIFWKIFRINKTCACGEAHY